MTFSDIRQLRRNLNNKILKVRGNYVWDYKVLDDQLRLISEPVAHSETFDRVTFKEVADYLETEDLDIVMEETGEVLQAANFDVRTEINFL